MAWVKPHLHTAYHISLGLVFHVDSVSLADAIDFKLPQCWHTGWLRVVSNCNISAEILVICVNLSFWPIIYKMYLYVFGHSCLLIAFQSAQLLQLIFNLPQCWHAGWFRVVSDCNPSADILIHIKLPAQLDQLFIRGINQSLPTLIFSPSFNQLNWCHQCSSLHIHR